MEKREKKRKRTNCEKMRASQSPFPYLPHHPLLPLLSSPFHHGFLVVFSVLSAPSKRVLTLREMLCLGFGLSFSSCTRECARELPLVVASRRGGSLMASVVPSSSIDPVVSDTKFVWDRSTIVGGGSRRGARPGVAGPARVALRSLREKVETLTVVPFPGTPGLKGPLGERAAPLVVGVGRG
jgi:hypothetical protein